MMTSMALLAVVLPALCGQADGELDVAAGRRELFLDDHCVAEMSGLVRTMHEPEKRGAVLKPDVPSDGTLVQIRSAPMWVPDEGVYKLIYNAYTMDDHSTIGPSLAVSKDGVHWEKPVIGELEVYGSKENNRIVLDADLHWPQNALLAVIYDEHDPDPARRYKGLLGAQGRTPAVSADCIHWKQLDVPKIPSSDESQLVYDAANGRFLAMVKGGNEYGRAFNITMSEDFEHWSAPRFLFGADAEDQPLAVEYIRRRLIDPGLAKPLFVDPDPAIGWQPPEGKDSQPTWRAECYNIPVFPYEGVYIGLPQIYYPTGQALPDRRNTDGFHLIHLAMTRDLETWTRLGERRPFIGPSRLERGLAGNYDRQQLCATNQPVLRGDELWFYYSGLKWRAHLYELWTDGSPRDPSTLSEEERADQADGWGAVCLAVLRRDGFMSLDATGEEGWVLTKPFVAPEGSLHLNVDAKGGRAVAAVCDEAGQPLAGVGESLPVEGDYTDATVEWNGAGFGTLAGKKVCLRIALSKAALYAFWID